MRKQVLGVDVLQNLWLWRALLLKTWLCKLVRSFKLYCVVRYNSTRVPGNFSPPLFSIVSNCIGKQLWKWYVLCNRCLHLNSTYTWIVNTRTLSQGEQKDNRQRKTLMPQPVINNKVITSFGNCSICHASTKLLLNHLPHLYAQKRW